MILPYRHGKDNRSPTPEKLIRAGLFQVYQSGVLISGFCFQKKSIGGKASK